MEFTRRQLLIGGASSIATLGAARASYNVVLGYDSFTGTNLIHQDLDPLVRENLSLRDGPLGTIDGHHIELVEDDMTIEAPSGSTFRVPLDMDSLDRAHEVERQLDLKDSVLADLNTGLRSVDHGAVNFEYLSYRAFFDRIRSHQPRPLLVQALRSGRRAERTSVERFVGIDPAWTPFLVKALADAFREHTKYDTTRYLAGSVEDNVIFGVADLRSPFESPTDFEALADGENSGMFCYELVFRSIEAFQTVPATEQLAPVFAGYVRNSRHKHAFTILGSVIERDGELEVPVTFIDYTRSTLYDDLRLRGIIGEGLDAYHTRQRAKEIRWSY